MLVPCHLFIYLIFFFFVLLIHDELCLQECQDHHAAKDGDGWVEQSGQSFFFGIFQKVCPF